MPKQQTFKDRGIERMSMSPDGKLDELLLTGDVHIERTGNQDSDQVWFLRIGGIAFLCDNLNITEIDEEFGPVPPVVEKHSLP